MRSALAELSAARGARAIGYRMMLPVYHTPPQTHIYTTGRPYIKKKRQWRVKTNYTVRQSVKNYTIGCVFGIN